MHRNLSGLRQLKVDAAEIRRALRNEWQAKIRYRDLRGKVSERVIWPMMISIFQGATVLAAWCTLRQDFRSFRLDGVLDFVTSNDRLPKSRKSLFAEWKKTETARYRSGEFAKEYGVEIRGV